MVMFFLLNFALCVTLAFGIYESNSFEVASVAFNPHRSFSAKAHKFLHAYEKTEDKKFPAFVFKPDCSIELFVNMKLGEVDRDELKSSAHDGALVLNIPTISKSKNWSCFYRSILTNGADNQLRISTVIFCPALESGSVPVVEAHNVGMCSLLTKAIEKEGDKHIKLHMKLHDMGFEVENHKLKLIDLDMGPLTLERGQNKQNELRFVSAGKIPVIANSRNNDSVAQEEDKCAAEWSEHTIIGRCFGLKTHSTYEQFKSVETVETATQCKAMCCELGAKVCVTWQYWIDIKMCKLGSAVRIGTEGANTPNWCDNEAPIVWSGEKLIRDSAGQVTGTPEAVPTQCFGLGAERMKREGDKKEKLTEAECKEACRATTDCRVWQAHSRRGCYYGSDKDVFCEPYKGGYTGGRRKCNAKC